MISQPIKHDAMDGRELVRMAFRHEVTPRVPWVPFAGVHAGSLKGYNATTLLRDEKKLISSLSEVNRLYRPDGLPVIFDLQIEAEILGCELEWMEKNPPAVKFHPFASHKALPDKIPDAADGRIPMVLKVMKEAKEVFGKTTALFGLICGPFTLCSHLRGTNLFMDLVKDPGYVADLMGYTTRVSQAMADLYTDAGMDIIAIVDPLVSQISPRHFEVLLNPSFREIFSHIRGRETLSALFVCGDATKNMEEMCKTGPDAIFVDENVEMVFAKQVADRFNITLGGNIPLVSMLLYGTQQDNMSYVIDLLEKIDHRNLIIAPGCDMPYDVPPENVIAVQEAIAHPEQVKVLLLNYQAPAEDTDIVLPDYEHLMRPLVEVFTLDSLNCAACAYMVEAALTAKEHFGDAIDIVEYKAVHRESMIRAKKMDLKKLPAILMNGRLKYSSLIPDQEELIAELKAMM